MAELKLRRLHRGFVFTDFDGNEVGCKDSEQAIDEIKKLLEPDKKFEKPVSEKTVAEKTVAERPAVEQSATEELEQSAEQSAIQQSAIQQSAIQQSAEQRGRRPRQNTVELHRKIFEAAKEQINLIGKVNAAQIARDLDVNASNVGSHLRQLDGELEPMIKKWQDERDKKMISTETRIDK